MVLIMIRLEENNESLQMANCRKKLTDGKDGVDAPLRLNCAELGSGEAGVALGLNFNGPGTRVPI